MAATPRWMISLDRSRPAAAVRKDLERSGLRDLVVLDAIDCIEGAIELRKVGALRRLPGVRAVESLPDVGIGDPADGIYY